ncbi:hypothetical protein EI94DRAFT_1825418 [Lactarius quietus]|nr:hypothetical protein EI94DRAFT_1825418 [Lactarius quietus]
MPPYPSIITSLVRRLCEPDTEDDPTTDLLLAFKGKARWLTRLKGPFINIAAVLWAGLSSDTPDDNEHMSIFDNIMKLHPKLLELVTVLTSSEELDGYHNFCHMMTDLMSDARASDTNCIISHIITYIPLDFAALSVAPPLLLNDKSKRGWNHNTTAAALCPLKLRTTFLIDPIAFHNSVQSGTLRIKTGDYPCFLYPDSARYNRNDCANGLFRGHIFIRALRSIYTGPSSAFTGHQTAARASNSELHGMKEVTPEMIAYISVQTHYALSDLRNWADINHSSFNYTKETLEYITSELPALKRQSHHHHVNTANSDSEQDSEDDTEAILAQQQDHDTQGNDNDASEEPGQQGNEEHSPSPHMTL